MWAKTACFFDDVQNFELLLGIKTRQMRDRTGSVKISLRMIEYCVTNFAQNHIVSFVVAQKDGERVRILEYIDPDYEQKKNVWVGDGWSLREFRLAPEYRLQILTFHKRLFDPCCRAPESAKIHFRGPDNVVVQTALQQLLFFQWFIGNGVLEWLMKNARSVHADMQTDERAKIDARQEARERASKRKCEDTYRPRQQTLMRKRARRKKMAMERPSAVVHMVIQPKVEQWK